MILEMDRNAGAFTDYFVLCSGTNPRQIQAIADDVEKQLAADGTRPNSVEGYNQAEWVLLDYVDFVVHVSARRLTPNDLKKKPAAKKAGRKAPAKAAGKSRTAARSRNGAGHHSARSKAKKRSRKSS